VVEWSCYHDPLRLRLGFDDLSPRETTPPRQTPAAPPRFSARAFFRRTHPTTHSRRTPARRGRLRRKKHASSALCVRSFLMHTHTCSLRHAHTQQTHNSLTLLFPLLGLFHSSPSPLAQNTRSFHTSARYTPTLPPSHTAHQLPYTLSLSPRPLSFSPLPRSCPFMHLSLPHL
jgi:hypothetical protein